MAQLKAPANLTVIRSTDRESALFVWDSVLQTTAGVTLTAEIYALNQSELNNGLGYAVVKDAIPHIAGAPRQFTSLDGLDPDMLYNFTVIAEAETVSPSEPSLAATDF
jgi:hypothetical protein